MGLKAIINEQKRQENNLNGSIELVEEQSKEIQRLSSVTLTQQLENQNMASALMRAKEEIESLEKRATIVNELEKKNKELVEENRKLLKLNYKVNKDKKQALEYVKYQEEQMKNVLEEKEQAKDNQYKVQKDFSKIESDMEQTLMRYRSLFIGEMIVTIALAIMMAYSKKEVLEEMISWFPARWENIKSIALWSSMKYMAAIQFINRQWKLEEGWSYVIVTGVSIIFLVGLFFSINFVRRKIKKFIINIRMSCKDILFKNIISGAIFITLFFMCIIFDDFIKIAMPFNILSIWIILGILGVAVWYIPEVISISSN